MQSMTNKRNHQSLKDNQSNGGVLTKHFVNFKRQEVIFHEQVTYQEKMAIPTWLKFFPDVAKGIVVSCKETF